MSANPLHRETLIEAYIETLLDGMDTKTLIQYAYDSLWDEYNDCTLEQITNEIAEYYSHLLEEITE